MEGGLSESRRLLWQSYYVRRRLPAIGSVFERQRQSDCLLLLLASVEFDSLSIGNAMIKWPHLRSERVISAIH